MGPDYVGVSSESHGGFGTEGWRKRRRSAQTQEIGGVSAVSSSAGPGVVSRKPPHCHVLVVEEVSRECICDICDAALSRGSVAASCRQCDYDECEACNAARKEVGGSGESSCPSRPTDLEHKGD